MSMEGFSNTVVWVIGVAAAGAMIWIIVDAKRRWRRQLIDAVWDHEEAEEMSARVLAGIRPHSGGPWEPVPLQPTFWTSTGWSKAKLLKLLSWMVGSGQLRLPDYDLTAALKHGLPLPQEVSMTQSSYDHYSPQRPSIVVHGPAHLGAGDQVVTGDFTFHFSDAERLAATLTLDLLQEAATQPRTDAGRLEQAARILSSAVESKTLDSDPRVRTTLKWLADVGTGATASIVSAGIIAGATTLLAMIT